MDKKENMMWLEIDIEPKAKGRPRVGARGNVYTPYSTRAYESAIRIECRSYMKRRRYKQITGAARVFLSFHFKRPKSHKGVDYPHTQKPDIDNLIKAVLDGMNGTVYHDDCQIVELSATKSFADADSVTICVSEARV